MSSVDYSITAPSRREDSDWRYLKDGHLFGMLDPSGDVTGPASAGLYFRDTRFLSRYQLKVDGARPTVLSSSISGDNAVLGVRLAGPAGLTMEREIYLFDNALNERLTLVNRGGREIEVEIEYAAAADFADIFEVRGQMTRPSRGELRYRAAQDGLCFRYRGLDGIDRSTRIELDAAARTSDAGRIGRRLKLPPGDSTTSTVRVRCCIGDRASPPAGFAAGLAALTKGRARRRAGAARVETSSGSLNEWLERSVADLYLLTTDTDRGIYPFAGLPWFSAAFGRDGIITALETLWLDPRIARGVLSFLAAHQAREVVPERDAEPGKILHEARFGEMANLAEVPFGRYYGSADATPLFVLLAGEYFGRTGDLPFIADLWPHLEAALGWVDRFGDLDGDGFVEYRRRTGRGLSNQGWKDSADSVFHADGEPAAGPIALVEIQGYVYAAKRHAAVLARALGRDALAGPLDRQADTLRREFEDRFWSERLGSYVLALDGAKRPCAVYASNPGHLMLTGIAASARARRVAELLCGPALFSGWGIRTVAATEARYDPGSYHNGSVWPHDNALIAMGFARHGFAGSVDLVFQALREASGFFESRRVPELFCGDARTGDAGPVAYPRACAPQAWAAGAPLAMLGAMLGIGFDPPGRNITLNQPRLPAGIEWLRVRGLRLGEASMDLTLARGRRGVEAAVDARHGDISLEVREG